MIKWYINWRLINVNGCIRKRERNVTKTTHFVLLYSDDPIKSTQACLIGHPKTWTKIRFN